MSGMLHEMLDIHGIIAERHLCFLLGSLKAPFEFLRRIGNSHAFAASAESRLNNDRITDLSGYYRARCGVIDRFGASGNDRHAGRRHGVPGLLLIPELCYDLRIRSDKSNITLFA